ncbi:hypothetical protein MPER_06794 [Moniliophthora perniciosa FA553]|nr:hypothetical protein MPER_06794 [Moniliophthora perniciosa FA553]
MEEFVARPDSSLSAHTVMPSSDSPPVLSEADTNATTEEHRSGSPTPVLTRSHSPTLPNVGAPLEENPPIRVSRPSRPPISKKSIHWDPKLGPQSRSHSPHHTSPPPREIRSSESASPLALSLPSETTPLLHTPVVSEGGGNGSSSSPYGSIPVPLPKPDLHRLSPCYISSKLSKKLFRRIDSVRKLSQADVKQNFVDLGKQGVRALPAVMLGCLLNILDGVSYGMIIFPTSDPFTTLGPMGVSMYFVSTITSQLVYTLGGSGFAGANGSMMIEVVPFFHILAQK